MTATATRPTAGSTAAGRSAGGATAQGGRRVWPWLVGVLGAVLVALVAGAPNQTSGRPYDPESNDLDGTKALVQLLRDFGAEVRVTDQIPSTDTDVAIMFPGEASDRNTAALRRWVSEGHTLVVTDTTSELVVWSGERNIYPVGITDHIGQGDCTVAAVAQARTLGIAERDQLAGYSTRFFPPPPGAGACYPQPEVPPGATAGALLVDQKTGKGDIVSFGLPPAFTNINLATDDNAVLAVALLAPRSGTKVAILEAPAGTENDRSLEDVLALGVKLGILQLGLAFVVYSFYRGRRLGKPVVEPQPVQIPGSELVSAVGNLLQQTRSPDRAAALLRADLRRRIGERLGLPADVTPQIMADTIEARTGMPVDESMPALLDLPCPTDADLLDLSARVDAVRRTVLGTGT